MKTKPLLITIGCILVPLLCIFFYIRTKHASKANTSEITEFVRKFNLDLQSGNMDSLHNYFAVNRNLKVKELLNVLANKSALGSKDSATFKTTLDIDKMSIISANSRIAVVNIPTNFTHDYIDGKASTITFTIRKIGEHQYKFVKVKADVFARDYMAYKARIDAAFPNIKPVEYSPITLAAFKTAETLKGKYDSVFWFQHINNQTWFYVVNGKLDQPYGLQLELAKDTVRTYKMGLLNPELKEIIPVQYDLVHNINGTFKGLIEVDKDHLHGFYTLDGKLAVPVEYEQVLPVNEGEHLAVMRKGDDYYWLNKDFTISAKADIKLADVLAQISQRLKVKMLPPEADIMEYNSHEDHSSLYIPPSYLVDLDIMARFEDFENPLRKNAEYDDEESETTAFNVDLDGEGGSADQPGVLQTLFYDVKDHYIGGRGDLYEKKTLIVLDKTHNRLLSHDIEISGEEGEVPSKCDEFNIRMLPDSLIEVKLTAEMDLYAPEDTSRNNSISEAPAYHYFKISNNKLVELKSRRNFAFTKFVKMDDSYLTGCYSYYNSGNHSDNYVSESRLLPRYYKYLINEIYADYNYKFKNDALNNGFKDAIADYKSENDNVDDSLTVIDKYNINWLRQKLAKPALKLKGNPLAMK